MPLGEMNRADLLTLCISMSRCTLTLKHGTEALGWVPKFKPEHIMEAAEGEVELILKNIL